MQPLLNPETLVFIDETGITTKMARPRGRSAKGHRCVAAIPFGHWMTTTVTAGLRLSGADTARRADGWRMFLGLC